MDPFLIGGAAYLAIAILISFAGRNRKLGSWGYFFASLLLTPVLGFLLLLASDPVPTRRVWLRRTGPS